MRSPDNRVAAHERPLLDAELTMLLEYRVWDRDLPDLVELRGLKHLLEDMRGKGRAGGRQPPPGPSRRRRAGRVRAGAQRGPATARGDLQEDRLCRRVVGALVACLCRA